MESVQLAWYLVQRMAPRDAEARGRLHALAGGPGAEDRDVEWADPPAPPPRQPRLYLRPGARSPASASTDSTIPAHHYPRPCASESGALSHARDEGGA